MTAETHEITVAMERALEHHHDETGETVPMTVLTTDSSSPAERREEFPESVGWAREVYQCPRCGDRTTLRLLAKVIDGGMRPR